MSSVGERLLIVVPTYNERENIESFLNLLSKAAPHFDVLFVDDDSPDGTGELVERIAGSSDRIHVIHRSRKEGIGPAYLAGFKWALRGGYAVIVQMDADLSHAPSCLPRMIKALEHCDMVVGSRWIEGGGTSDWSFWRVLLSRAANAYASLVLGVPIHDLTGGFNCYKRKVLEGIDLERIQSNGYSFQIEMKYRAIQNHFKLVEIPIVFAERRAGVSKISRGIVLEALGLVWKLKLSGKRRSGRAGADPASGSKP